MMASIFAAIELVWFWGASRRAAALKAMSPQLDTLLAAHGGPDDPLTSLTVRGPPIALLAPAGARRLSRTRGVALYLTDVPSAPGEDRAPPVLAHQLARLPILFEYNIFLTVRTVPVHDVPPASRFLVASASVPGFAHVIARYGYLERPRLDAGFADALLDHILDRLYSELAAAARAEPGLRAALHLPDNLEEVAAAAAAAAVASGEAADAPFPPVPPPVAGSAPTPASPFKAAAGAAAPAESPTDPAAAGLTSAHARVLRASLSRAVSRSLSSRASGGVGGGGGGGGPALAPVVPSPGIPGSSPRGGARAGSPTHLAPVSEPDVLAEPKAAAAVPPPPPPLPPPDPARFASLTARADTLLAEIAVIEHARSQAAVVFVCGTSVPLTPAGTVLPQRALLCAPYSMLVSAFEEPASSALGIPGRDLLGLVLPYEL
jgi:hypothetical protein